jgi:hypothetical protein
VQARVAFTPGAPMATAAEPLPVTKLSQRDLAQELLGLERKHGKVFARMDDLKGALRKLAGDAGENFKEEFAGKGVVKVSAPKDGKFKGILPLVNEERFLALPKAEQDKLTHEDKGVITMTPTYGGKYYGSVTVDLF